MKSSVGRALGRRPFCETEDTHTSGPLTLQDFCGHMWKGSEVRGERSPGSVGNHPWSPDKMKGKSEGKGELAVSFSGKGKGKWRKPHSAKHLQDKLAAWKSKSTCHECGQRAHWAGDPKIPWKSRHKFHYLAR